MPTYSLFRSVTPEEAQLAALYGVKHVAADVRSAGLTITPSKPGGKIVVVAMMVQTDSIAAMTVAVASSGVSSRTIRVALSTPTLHIPSPFVGADGQTVTFTPAGYAAGTYAEIGVTYYEI